MKAIVEVAGKWSTSSKYLQGCFRYAKINLVGVQQSALYGRRVEEEELNYGRQTAALIGCYSPKLTN